jgi:hypothetical protein
LALAPTTARLPATGHSEAAALLRRPRLKVAQYHRMGEAGVLVPEQRVVPLQGEVVAMAPTARVMPRR